MATDLPDKLKNFKHKRKRFWFQIVNATVLKSSRWSETYVSGGGGGSFGTTNGYGSGSSSMTVDSTVIENN